MSSEPFNAVLHYLRRSLDSGSSDGDLLSPFTIDRDPVAFEELLRRYESMVMNLCRRQLGPGADADDAFQATFFILARKAGTISPPVLNRNGPECLRYSLALVGPAGNYQ